MLIILICMQPKSNDNITTSSLSLIKSNCICKETEYWTLNKNIIIDRWCMFNVHCLWNERFWLNYSILQLTNRSSNFKIGNEQKKCTLGSIKPHNEPGMKEVPGKWNQINVQICHAIFDAVHSYNGNSSTVTNIKKIDSRIRFVI